MKSPRRKWWRRKVLWALAVLVLPLGGAYVYNTRPSKLRAHVTRALGIFEFTDCSIGEISFTPWNGLEIVGLELTLSDESPLYDRLRGTRAGSLVRVAYARLQCSPWDLLAGRVRPTELLLRDAVVSIVRDARTGESNWSFRLPAETGPRRPEREFDGTPPRITLENADIRLMLLERGEPRIVRRWVIDATGELGAGAADSEYTLRVERVLRASVEMPERSERPDSVLAELRWRPAPARERPTAEPALSDSPASLWLDQLPGRLELRLDWLDIETVSLFLPRALTDTLADFGLTGRARIDRFVIRDNAIEAAEFRFADLGVAFPVEQTERRYKPHERFLRLADASGELVMTGRSLTLTASGHVNGAAARLRLDAHAPALRETDSNLPSTATARPEDLVAWPYTCELQIDAVELPVYETQLDFVESPRLPLAVRRFFRDYRPRGRCNARVTITGTLATPGAPAGANRPTINGEIEPLGASCRYFRFPYEVEDVRGRFRFEGGAILLENLHGRHGSARIRVDGRIEQLKRWTGLDLTVRGESVPLDADLYAALPQRDRKLWERVSPSGLADVFATIHRDAGTPDGDRLPVQVTVDVRLINAMLSVGESGRLTEADGLVTIANRVVTIHDLHGALGEAEVRLSGVIRSGAPGANADVDLHVEAVGVPFRRSSDVTALIPRTASLDSSARNTAAEAPPRTSEVRVEGVCDVWGRISSTGPNGEQERHYVAHVRDGTLVGFDPSQVWTNADGWIVLADGRSRIQSFSAAQGDAWLEATGTLPDRFGPGEPMTLQIRAAHPSMERLVSQWVPAPWEQVGEALGLSGKGWVSLHLRSDRSNASEARQIAEIRLESERIQPGPMPLELNAVKIHATLDAHGLVLHQAGADYGDDGHIQMSGTAGWKEGQRWLDLTVSTRELVVSDKLIDALPQGLADILRRMSAKGRVNATFDRIRYESYGGPAWQITGRLALEQAELQLGLLMSDFAGHLNGTCTIQPDGRVALDGSFYIDHGKLADRDFERFEGLLARGSDDRWVRLDDVRGRLCDGEVVGKVRFDPSTREYELTVTLVDMSLDKLLHRADSTGGPVSERSSSRRGRLSGTISLSGVGGDDATRRGNGRLRIVGASLLRTPVLKFVAEASRQADRQMDETLERCDLDFVWQGDELKLTRVDIRSPNARLVGEGTWNIRDDSLELVLIGARPQNAPHIAILSELFDAAREELVQYRVEGFAASPRVTVEPLHNLTDPIRRLLQRNQR